MADTQIVKVVDQKTYSVSYLIGALIAGLIVGSLLSILWFKTGKPEGTSTAGTPASETEKKTTPDTASGDTKTTAPSASESPATSTPSKTSDNTKSETTVNPGGMLSIADQSAGVSVDVAQAQVSSDQWIVIRESKDGKQGNVLGAARFVGGATSGKVELLRTTEAGKTYFGLIYKDNGDRTFSLADDTPVLDASGNPILVSFTAK